MSLMTIPIIKELCLCSRETLRALKIRQVDEHARCSWRFTCGRRCTRLVNSRWLFCLSCPRSQIGATGEVGNRDNVVTLLVDEVGSAGSQGSGVFR